MRSIALFTLGLLALVAAVSAVATAAPGPPRATGEFTITSSRAQVAVRPAGAPTRTARSFVDARPGLTGASRAGATIVQGSTTPLIGGGTAVVVLVAVAASMKDSSGRKLLYNYWEKSLNHHSKQVAILYEIATELKKRNQGK